MCLFLTRFCALFPRLFVVGWFSCVCLYLLGVLCAVFFVAVVLLLLVVVLSSVVDAFFVQSLPEHLAFWYCCHM